MGNRYTKILTFAAIFLGIRLGVRYLLPLMLPFLLGAVLALAAEPVVGFLNRKMGFPRGLGAGIGVSFAIALFIMLVMLLAALIIRELGVLAGALPDLGETAKSGLAALSGWLKDLTRFAPKSVRKPLSDSISELFSGGSALLDRLTEVALSLAGGVLRAVPDSALGLGTAVISAYMISARLPKLRAGLKELLGERLRPLVETLGRIKTAVLGWLKAQLKLMTVTFGVVSLGFLLLRIPYGLLWAAVVALVDAFPVLGTGTVLVPWSIVCFLQGDSARGIGLLGIYGAGTLIRSALEPKLVGKHLGLDPLVTLIALYAGYKLWGLMGMLLAPLLAVAATQVVVPKRQDSL